MRMKVTKVLLSLMVALVCMINFGITAYADEEYESGMTREEVIEKYSVDTGNTQADAIFNNYLQAASNMMVEERYAETMTTWYVVDESCSFLFEQYCGISKEVYAEMTTFEKLIWKDFYLVPQMMLSMDNVDTSTFDTCFPKMGKDGYDTYLSYDDEVLAEAFKAMMEWQYYYIIDNGAVYNFITGVDSLGNSKIDEISEVIVEEQPIVGTEEVIAESSVGSDQDGMVETLAEEPKEEGIWDDTVESAKSHVLTFVILGVLVVALVGVIIYRKSKGIDDDKVA